MKQELFFKLKIAVVLAIIIGYGIYIIVKYRKESEEKFKIVRAKCPDYWEVLDNNKCKNVKKLGQCSNTEDNNIMDFSDDMYKHPKNGNYFKCVWAKNCEVSWQGIDLICN